MSYAIAISTTSVRAVIEAEVTDVWVTSAGYPPETIEWPNQHMIKPASGPWIRVSYPQQSTQAETYGPGTTLSLTLAVLSIQIFWPKNEGLAGINTVTDAFRSHFERKHFGAGIEFRACQGPAQIDEAVWAGVLLNFPFSFREEIS